MPLRQVVPQVPVVATRYFLVVKKNDGCRPIGGIYHAWGAKRWVVWRQWFIGLWPLRPVYSDMVGVEHKDMAS